MKPIAYVPFMKDKDKNTVVRLKDFKKMSGLIGPKALRSFVIKGRKLNQTTDPPCEDSFNMLVRG